MKKRASTKKVYFRPIHFLLLLAVDAVILAGVIIPQRTNTENAQLLLEQKQEELNAREFSASSGGGMVKVTVNGAREVLSVEIDPQCVDPDDVEMLQDLVLSAVNGALKEAASTVEQEMGKLTGGMNLPF